MGLFNRGSSKWHGVDFMTLIPVRVLESEDGSRDGQIVVLQPRYPSGLLGRFLQPRLGPGKRFIRIPLEDRGSFLWRHADGKRSVGELAGLFAGEFAEDTREAPQRVATFLYHMLENGFIKFSNLRP